jgi:hypothetical protein
MIDNNDLDDLIYHVNWSNRYTKIWALSEYFHPVRNNGMLSMLDQGVDDDDIVCSIKLSLSRNVDCLITNEKVVDEQCVIVRTIMKQMIDMIIHEEIDWYQIVRWFRAFRTECPASTTNSQMDW